MERESKPLRATLWVSGAVASFSAMAIGGRAVSVELDTFEIMLFRSLIGVAIVLSVGGIAGTLGQIRTGRLGLHFVRNASHFAGQNLWFYAVALIPFAQLFALEFTTPLWVAVFAPLVLGERMTRARMASVALGFTGILIVARPGMIQIGPGVVAAALCAVGFAGSVLATKLLSRTETTTCILFWLTTMQAGLGLACAGIDGSISLPSAQVLPWVVLVGCTGLLAHYCLTTALTLAPATIVAPLDFARLPLMAIVGMAFYAEPLELPVFVGAALVFAANYLNLRAETRARLAA